MLRVQQDSFPDWPLLRQYLSAASRHISRGADARLRGCRGSRSATGSHDSTHRGPRACGRLGIRSSSVRPSPIASHVFLGKAFTQLTSLGIEKVQDRQKRCVRDGPDNIEPPAQILDTDGRDLNDNEIGDPIGHGRGGGALGAHRQRVDLSRVQPGDAEHAQAEADVVQEEEDDGGLRHFFLTWITLFLGVVEQDGHEQEAEELYSRRDHHHDAPPVPLHQGRGGQRGEEVHDGADGGDEPRHGVAEVDRFHEEGRQIVRHDVDAAELLHCLSGVEICQ